MICDLSFELTRYDYGTGRRRASRTRLNEAYQRVTGELAKVIVGQQQVIEELLMAMFARGHCLLVGVPGLAKTLMIRTLADASVAGLSAASSSRPT